MKVALVDRRTLEKGDKFIVGSVVRTDGHKDYFRGEVQRAWMEWCGHATSHVGHQLDRHCIVFSPVDELSRREFGNNSPNTARCQVNTPAHGMLVHKIIADEDDLDTFEIIEEDIFYKLHDFGPRGVKPTDG